MADPEFKTYRIPLDPVGRPYYRRGQMYEPGSKVTLPANEDPPGWKGGKPVDRHAWKLLEEGKQEASDEQLSAVEKARQEKTELEKKLEEQKRLVQELEEAAGPDAKPKETTTEEEPEPTDPTAEEGEDAGGEKKGKAKKRSKDPEV